MVHGTTRVLNESDFTNTVPPYADPEFDQPQSIKIETEPNNGVILINNGQLLGVGDVIDVETMNLTATDNGSNTDAHIAEYEFTVQSYNFPEYSTVKGKLILNIYEEVNYPPNAQAGADKTLLYDSEGTGNGNAYLSGSGSTDPNQQTLTYQWYIIGNNHWGITLLNDDTVNCTAQGQNLDFIADGSEIQLKLRVTDTEGAFDEDTVKITLNDINGFEEPN